MAERGPEPSPEGPFAAIEDFGSPAVAQLLEVVEAQGLALFSWWLVDRVMEFGGADLRDRDVLCGRSRRATALEQGVYCGAIDLARLPAQLVDRSAEAGLDDEAARIVDLGVCLAARRYSTSPFCSASSA